MKKLILALPIALMACAPPPLETVEPIPVGDEPSTSPTTAGQPPNSGLQERLPDTCGLDAYQGFVGQQVAAITYPAGDTVRVVQPGEILSQLYMADRVNLYVDGAGVVQRVICG